MQVRYFNEFKWVEEADGTIWVFRDDAGEHVAEVALHDPEHKMWRFTARVPPRYCFNGSPPAGLVHSCRGEEGVRAGAFVHHPHPLTGTTLHRSQ